MVIDREKLLQDLHEHVIEVTFTKVNGQERVMKCTLMGEYLPKNADQNHLKEEHKKPENQSTIVAWDVNANGWRSFRVDSVSYIQALQGF